MQLATHCFSCAFYFARLFWRSFYRQSYDVSRSFWILSARVCFSKSIKIWAFWKDICILFLCFCPLFSNNCTPLSLLDSLIYIIMLKTRWSLFFLSVNLKFSLISLNFMHLIAHFTILDINEDGVDLVLIQPLLHSYVNLVVLLLTSIFKHNVHTKTKKVCIITRSTSASHSLEG